MIKNISIKNKSKKQFPDVKPETWDFEMKLHSLVHKKTNTEKLLKILKIKFIDDLSTKKPETIKLLDQGANLISKFIFIERHFDYYFLDKHRDVIQKNDDYFRVDWFHLYDQLKEVKLESLHSLLIARSGMIKQATNTLRRCFELSLYGVFHGINFVELEDKTKLNPFVVLAGTVWSENVGSKSILRRELWDVIKKIRKVEKTTNKKASVILYNDFSRHYIENFCEGFCEKHYDKGYKLTKYNDQMQYIDSSFVIKCSKCSRVSTSILIERPIPLKIMIEQVVNKLGNPKDDNLDINGIYKELSEFVHPNPISHQHEPEFIKKDIIRWLDLLRRTLSLSIWFYTKGMECIGYKEAESYKIFEKKDFDIKKITLNDLIDSICKRGREEFLEKEN